MLGEPARRQTQPTLNSSDSSDGNQTDEVVPSRTPARISRMLQNAFVGLREYANQLTL